jgi:hypothetical protein
VVMKARSIQCLTIEPLYRETSLCPQPSQDAVIRRPRRSKSGA